MNKTISIIAIVFGFSANAQNISPSEALKLIKQPLTKVSSSLSSMGYSYDGKDDGFFIFHKGRYELTVSAKGNTVTALSSEELVSDYRKILMDFQGLGLKFSHRNTRYPDGPPAGLPPASGIRFDKKPNYTCYIVTPYNLNQTLKITVTYSTYQVN